MKNTINYAIVAVIGTVVPAGSGCGNQAANNPPPATNSVSGPLPSTNNLINNNPPTGMTNAPMPTNSANAPEK